MADFGLTPEGAQAAKVAASGGFGGLVLIYLRHPGSLVRALCLVLIAVVTAMLFAGVTADFIGITPIQAAALVGLLGKAITEGVLRAIEKLDFGALLPVKGEKK